MATHTKEDIDRLMEAISEIWRKNEPEPEKKTEPVKVYFNNKKVLFN
jgi:hypothetical protein